jgi:hypothetical protein
MMGLKELFGFMKRRAQKFANLSLRKLTGAIAVKREDFQGAPLAMFPVEVQLPGERIRNFNRDDHVCIVSKSGNEDKRSSGGRLIS